MRKKGECAVCHEVPDLTGFGLENYGPPGEWRPASQGETTAASLAKVP